MKKVFELYRYRNLLLNLTASELKLRYRRSVLGFLWTMLNPLLMMLVLTLVFSTVMRFNTKDYSILLLSGLMPWTFFSQSVSLSLMSIIGKGALLKKVYIPKAVLPLSAVLATMVNFILSMVPLLCVAIAMGHPVSWQLAFLPVSVVIMAVFTAGLSFIFSCLNVFFRDFGHMTDVILQAWFYASPIIYTTDMIPEAYRAAFAWNPMLYLIECFREPIFHARLPDLNTALIAGGSALLAASIGFFLFIRYERHFVLKV